MHLEYYMKEIDHIENEDESAVIREEKTLKGEYKSKQRAINQEKESKMAEKKKNELNARMDRAFKKVGRTAMPRSMKKKVKREKQEVVVDEETLDRLKYLGEVEPPTET